jgi:hypothetical protein
MCHKLVSREILKHCICPILEKKEYMEKEMIGGQWILFGHHHPALKQYLLTMNH